MNNQLYIFTSLFSVLVFCKKLLEKKQYAHSSLLINGVSLLLLLLIGLVGPFPFLDGLFFNLKGLILVKDSFLNLVNIKIIGLLLVFNICYYNIVKRYIFNPLLLFLFLIPVFKLGPLLNLLLIEFFIFFLLNKRNKNESVINLLSLFSLFSLILLGDSTQFSVSHILFIENLSMTTYILAKVMLLKNTFKSLNSVVVAIFVMNQIILSNIVLSEIAFLFLVFAFLIISQWNNINGLMLICLPYLVGQGIDEVLLLDFSLGILVSTSLLMSYDSFGLNQKSGPSYGLLLIFLSYLIYTFGSIGEMDISNIYVLSAILLIMLNTISNFGLFVRTNLEQLNFSLNKMDALVGAYFFIGLLLV